MANGYAPLGSGTMIDPVYVLPGFSAASAGTFWVKSNTGALVPQGALTSDTNGITVQNIRLGLISSGRYGTYQTNGSLPLFLQAGSSSNVVYIANGQTLGGEGNTWLIGPTGSFTLGGGSFSGSVAFGGGSTSLTGINTLVGSRNTLNLTSGSMTGAGDFTFALTGGGGLVVPSTASTSNTTYALNYAAAKTIFGLVGSSNTWTQVQTFTSNPVFNSNAIPQSAVIGLSSTLSSLLSLSGGTLSGALSLGGFKITNLSSPASSGDAVNKGYADATYMPIGTSTIATATTSGSSTLSGTATYALTSGTASFTSGTANYALTSGTSAHSYTSDTATALVSSPALSGTLSLNGILWITGAGAPAVAAPVGSMYSRTDGGASTTLYVKESGTGTTGWVGK